MRQKQAYTKIASSNIFQQEKCSCRTKGNLWKHKFVMPSTIILQNYKRNRKSLGPHLESGACQMSALVSSCERVPMQVSISMAAVPSSKNEGGASSVKYQHSAARLILFNLLASCKQLLYHSSD